MTEIDQFIKTMRQTIETYKKTYHNRKKEFPEKMKLYDSILESKKSSKEFRAIAILYRNQDYANQARLAGEIAHLYDVVVLGEFIAILEKKIDLLVQNLDQTGVLQKVKAIGDVAKLKKDLNNAITLLARYYEEKKKREEEAQEIRKKNLSQYVS